MTPKQFTELTKLSSATEADKAVLVAFYLLKIKDMPELPLTELSKTMVEFGLTNPNQSRLRKHPVFARAFMKGSGNNIKLKLKALEELEIQHPQISLKSEEIVSDDIVLPEDLYLKTRGYIISVAKQINASYQYNLFDGCALLMRRLIEMLIIITYQHLGREKEIQDSNGGFQPLSYLINYSLTHQVLKLSRDSNSVLDTFRQLGNYSAHSVDYNCRKGDIDNVRIPFRACIESLLYKSGVKQ